MGNRGRRVESDELVVAATSGLMALTGRSDGPPLAPPPGLVYELDRLASAITRWSSEIGDAVKVDWAELVTVRAQHLGMRRHGSVSANGWCRLLEGPDGWMAVNLARADDRASLEAVVGSDPGADPWLALQRALDRSSVTELTERARLVGMPAAPLEASGVPADRPPSTTRQRWPRTTPRRVADLRIVDLSSMWAGPLAASLLSRSGGRIVKVESSTRPDGGRAEPSFYATLHGHDQEVVTLDFTSHEGRRQLRHLVNEADIVIESSRPRALEQLGVGPDTVDGPSGKVWVSITGYGRDEPGRNWVAFGDDAAVAGGVVAWEHGTDPVFCGDAVADPVSGMVAAGAAFEALAAGGGVLIDVSMQACGASLVTTASQVPATPAVRSGQAWWVEFDGTMVPVRDRADESQSRRWTTRPATTVARAATV